MKTRVADRSVLFSQIARLDALSKFVTRWARHDADCRSLTEHDACTCGYNAAAQALVVILRGAPPSEHGQLAEYLKRITGSALPDGL